MKRLPSTTAGARRGSKGGAGLGRLLLAPVLGCVFGACVAQGEVVRSYEGTERAGRLVHDESYAHYARGAYLEAAGFYEQAAEEYRAVLHQDVQSVAAWTRLAATLCASGKQASQEFDRARSLSTRFAPYWYELALCQERHGKLREAAESADRAVTFGPGVLAHTLLAARLHEDLRDERLAANLLVGAVLRNPTSVTVRQALAGFADRQRDGALRRIACCMVADQPPASASGSAHPDTLTSIPPSDRLAMRETAAPSLVDKALCAASMADTVLAKHLGSSILASDPENADAAVALLYAADLTNDSSLFRQTLGHLGPHPRLTLELSHELFRALMRRRVGSREAALWSEAWLGTAAALQPARCEAMNAQDDAVDLHSGANQDGPRPAAN